MILQNSFDVGNNYGPSDYDVRHRLQSGNPISIVTAINTFTGVNNALRPDLVGHPRIIGAPNQWFDNTVCDPRVAGSCTSSSDFALPVSPAGAFRFGNLGRNAIYGPGFANTDLSLIKNTKIGGTTRLQLRVEAFDVFNHANLGQPGRIAAVGSTVFGVISNTRFPTGDSGSSRQIQFAVKLLF